MDLGKIIPTKHQGYIFILNYKHLSKNIKWHGFRLLGHEKLFYTARGKK
jgi:hypothetical protein